MRILNISLDTISKYLMSLPGLEPKGNLDFSTKLSDVQYEALIKRFSNDSFIKAKANTLFQNKKNSKKIIQKNNEDDINGITIPTRVILSVLQYENHKLFYQIGNRAYVLINGDTPAYVKSDAFLEKNANEEVGLLISNSKNSFVFQDAKMLSRLNTLSTQIEKEKRDAHIKLLEQKKKEERERKREEKELKIAKKEIQTKEEKKNKQKNEYRIQLNKLRFGNNVVSLIYKKRRYVYRDYNIKDYDKVLKQIYSRVSKTRENDIKTSLIWVEIDIESQTFKFIDVDINKYIKNLKDTFLPQSKKEESHNVLLSKNGDVSPKTIPALNSMILNSGNIHFYNGYFLIFLTTNGEIDCSVEPYRVNDTDSYEILNLVHKYFEQRFEQMRITIKYDEKQIHKPSNLEIFQLRNYVKALRRNLDVKGDWWEEVHSVRKRTFGQCFGVSNDYVKYRYIRSKNEYLYNLSSLQNEKKLILVYENNHGRREDAFIFSIDMPGNRNAIVFENASNEVSTTTWLFVAHNKNYDKCVNLIFDYFTDYTISSKRSSLREKSINPPQKFKAESYSFIDHGDLEQWLKKLNRIIDGESKPSEIQFEPGLKIPQSSEIRYRHIEAISTKNLHNQLMVKLYDRLCCESGQENVGTEIRIGNKRIDAVVKGENCFDIYEVKTASDSFDCVTEALGQLCQYAYLYCRDKIGKMVIVGSSIASKEVEEYLSWFRKNHSMKVYYLQVPL